LGGESVMMKYSIKKINYSKRIILARKEQESVKLEAVSENFEF